MVRQVGMYLKALVINILAFSLVTSSGSAEEIAASPSKGISLTIYNQNFGLVRDTRSINLKKGINHLRLEDIAAQIDPTSVSFVSLTAPNSVVVREQNYQFDLMNPNTVLSKSIGKRATFRQFLSSGQVSEISGILLNSPLVTVGSSSGISSTQYQQLVIRTDDGIILNPQGQVELASLPEGLVSKPSLLWKLEAGKPG